MRKRMIPLLFLGILMLSIVGCGQGSTSAEPITSESPVENNTEGSKLDPINGNNQLVLAMTTPTTFNPLYNTQTSVEQALYLIFSPLINIEESGLISPNLAESWVTNENNTSITITLKSGVTWHDGMPLTSDDVIFTLEQIKNINNCIYAQAVTNIQSMERVDSTTFKIIYKQSFSGILQTLFFPVIPQHIYETSTPNDISLLPIGSGPYRYVSSTSLDAIYLEANETYFKGTPNINTIQIKFIPDEISSLYAFKQGLVDLVYTSETEWGKYTSSTSNLTYEMISPIYEFMGVNLNRPIFQDAAIRNALGYGLNREDIVRLYYLDHAIVADTPISPASYLFDKTLATKSYDKEKAKLLLTQSGYQLDAATNQMYKGGNIFSFTLMVNEENKDRIKVAKEIQKMYAEIGINIELEIVDTDTYFSRLINKQYDAFLGGWKLSYATDLSFALHSSQILNGMNYVSFKSEQMDALLQQAFLATSDQVSTAYSKLQEYFSTTSPYISLYFKKSVLMMKDKIGGTINPTPLNVFANIEEWHIRS